MGNCEYLTLIKNITPLLSKVKGQMVGIYQDADRVADSGHKELCEVYRVSIQIYCSVNQNVINLSQV